MLCYISKILKNESNSQHCAVIPPHKIRCVISQRYSKMKAIHNLALFQKRKKAVVLYLKDTQKWKQFTTKNGVNNGTIQLCYISKILKNESNSQQKRLLIVECDSCVISQRYSKMKAIHNELIRFCIILNVVLYLKDTQKWKQFTTPLKTWILSASLCYISKILKNESNSQRLKIVIFLIGGCVISQRYSKMKAIHNYWR